MTERHPYWAGLAALHLYQMHLGLLKGAIAKAEPASVSWRNPVIECQYPINWDWENAGPKELAATGDSPTSVENGIDLLDVLTNGAGWKVAKGIAFPMVTPEQHGQLEQLPNTERHRFLDAVLEPFVLVLGSDADGIEPDRENMFALPDIHARGQTKVGDITVGARFEVHPFVADYDAGRAYYPVITSLTYSAPPERISDWLLENGSEVFAQLDRALKAIEAAVNMIATEEAGKRALSLPQPDPGPRRTFPEQRRTIMSPVPMPRAAAKEAASVALIRGLGRMFAGYSNVRDLDISGAIATAEAERALWEALERALQATGIDYSRSDGSGAVTYVLRGVRKEGAQDVWDATSRSLNKGEGGPGIEAQPPRIDSLSRFQGGQMVSETQMVFWPRAEGGGRTTPPVRFRSESSPGYVALLEEQGSRPYFADGWLWIRRGDEREGFRIGGLSTLLFPEGRAALERMAETQIADREGELNRIFRNPMLFADADQKAVQDLRAGIERLRRWLAGLSVYDSSHDLILCVFEAFYRQRDHWARQELALRGGRVVGTAPWRIIRLDPSELRLRLDPGAKWGDNWRARLLEKLEALATFERQTRSRNGRKVDVGDRLVLRIIDGLRGQDTPGGPEWDPGIGLTRLLARAGALTTDAFYIEVSVEFMGRLVTWAVNEGGAVKWGIDAARCIEQQGSAADQGAVDQARRQPYFHHSPRLLAFSNLEGWSVTRKLLASTLLQEATPGRKRRATGPDANHPGRLLVKLGGREYVNSNGAHGRGYRVEVWMQKAGYDSGGGIRNAFTAFVEDLRALSEALDLYLEIGDQGTGPAAAAGASAIAGLERLQATPEDALPLKMRAYLPADLEGHLRVRLAEKAHIDACDAAEAGDGNAGRISGRELRAARLEAGLDQAQLAREIGVSKMSISQWESGQKAVPVARLARIREVLGGVGRRCQ